MVLSYSHIFLRLFSIKDANGGTGELNIATVKEIAEWGKGVHLLVILVLKGPLTRSARRKLICDKYCLTKIHKLTIFVPVGYS